MAGWAHLEGAASATRFQRGELEADRRKDSAKRRHGNAQLRGRADAAREIVSRRRRRAHRAADGRERIESRRFRRARAGGWFCGVLQHGEKIAARELFSEMPAARVEGTALFVVDDVDAAPVRYGQRLRPAPPARRA